MNHPTIVRNFAIILALLFIVPSANAQYENDTKTVDSTLEALYDVISGPAGEARDWDRFRNLFVADAKLIPIAVRPDSTFPFFLGVEDYITRAGAGLEQNGFFEKEVSRKTEEYGHMVHAFSTYESFRTAEETEPFMRGINSIQLMHNGDRWYVVNIMWDAERPGQEIPDKYLD